MKHLFAYSLLLSGFLIPWNGISQDYVSDSTIVRLKEVTVNAIGVEQDYQSYGGNISIIKQSDLETADPTNIQESINRIPGVYMHSGTINTNRITIRGIGSRSPFSTNKIRAYFGEIPLTNGSGETNIEDIDLAGLRSYEIIKGPNASVFGSGLGGVILMNPIAPTTGKATLTNDLTVGSFGLVKEQLRFAMGTEKLKVFATAGHLTSSGYRDNNEVDRSHTLVHIETALGNGKLNFLTYFVDQKAFIPSSINETDFEQSPIKAAFTWGSAEGFEDYATLLQGVSYSTLIGANLTLKSSIFVTNQNNYEPRPFNILDESTTGVGTRNRLIFDFSEKTTWMIGTELFWDQHSFQTLANLYRDFPGMGSVAGDQLSDLKERRNYINAFTQLDHELADGLIMTAGLNFNKTQYVLEDRFDAASGQNGDYDYQGVLSPRLALNYQITPRLSTYFAVSHGFSPPTLEETLLPDGAINPDIEPETGWNTEVGLRGFFGRATFDLTLYRMQISNLLVARRTAEDQFIGINAGETSHQGVELSFLLEFINTPRIELSNQGSYSFSDFTFDEFVDGENTFSGNQLTGVPKQTFFNRLQFQFKPLVYLYLDQQYTSAIPITDDNTIFSNQYLLVNATIGHAGEIGPWKYDLGFTARNITEQKYASMLLINATGFGGAAPRYFYPGLPLNWFTRLRVAYTF
ncbi:MAG: TonB-dependent receptor [Cytophagales bacterium]|nr:TonB-dependent receptor [Cytophagales bacterium]